MYCWWLFGHIATYKWFCCLNSWYRSHFEMNVMWHTCSTPDLRNVRNCYASIKSCVKNVPTLSQNSYMFYRSRAGTRYVSNFFFINDLEWYICKTYLTFDDKTLIIFCWHAVWIVLSLRPWTIHKTEQSAPPCFCVITMTPARDWPNLFIPLLFFLSKRFCRGTEFKITFNLYCIFFSHIWKYNGRKAWMYIFVLGSLWH